MAAFAAISFFSCSNDMQNVIKVSELEKLPELSGDNIVFSQTEYGKIVISISAPKIIKTKTEDDKNKMEFPSGLTVVQYSEYPDTLSMISAEYAVNYEEKGVWEARGNVIAMNKKNQETLNTEYLVWDQTQGIISSNKKVQVSTPDDIIFGEGFQSDDQFNDWQVEKVTGIITFENEELPVE
ncbi:MAG: LPS export ABC transporter periplasmic protein LptC [Bacteroidales bacterium]|nr:LPS export ABC transporter periplasmic protein LptC [Bacteroidales bacterium]